MIRVWFKTFRAQIAPNGQTCQFKAWWLPDPAELSNFPALTSTELKKKNKVQTQSSHNQLFWDWNIAFQPIHDNKGRNEITKFTIWFLCNAKAVQNPNIW